MINKKPITLNDDLFNAMVEVVSDNPCEHRHITNFEENLFFDLSFKNAVFYMAEQSARKYSGGWRVAHIKHSDLCFLHLETTEAVELYQFTKEGNISKDIVNVDGHTFGLLMSLHAYRFMYFASLQRGMKAQALTYNNYGSRLKKAINKHSKAFIAQAGHSDIYDSEALQEAIEIINHNTEKDYAL